MPRPRNEVPSYLRHESGQAFIRVDGRQVYLGVYDSPESRVAYEREVAAWQAHGQPKRRRSDPPLTVAGLVVRFWQHVEREGLYRKNDRDTSERGCLRIALRPVLRLFAGKPAAAFGPLDLVTVRKELCKPLPPPKAGETRRRVHVGPIVRTSVNKHLHRIRGVFRWAVSMELVPPATLEALRAVPAIRRGQAVGTREGQRVRPAPLRAVVAVLRRVTAPVAAMIRLQWLTGARPGEIVQMRLGDVDRTGEVWIYRPGSHKTEHHDIEREVMLGPKSQRVLAPFLTLDRGAWVFPGVDTRKRKGQHVTEAAYCKAITRACTEAGVARWTPNQLRHNAATRFRGHSGIEAARTALGHTDAATTLIYAEADRRRAIDLARSLA